MSLEQESSEINKQTGPPHTKCAQVHISFKKYSITLLLYKNISSKKKKKTLKEGITEKRRAKYVDNSPVYIYIYKIKLPIKRRKN